MNKVRAGEKLSIAANDWNKLVDLANARTMGGDGSPLPNSSPVKIQVRNDTGADLPRRSVVGLSDSAISLTSYPTDWKAGIAISGVEPAAEHIGGKYAVLVDSITDGQYGEAVVAGVIQVLLDVVNEDHEYADVTAGEVDKLQTAATGSARIIWKESGTGDKLAIVQLLGTVPTPFVEYPLITAVEGFYSPSSSSVILRDGDENGWIGSNRYRGTQQHIEYDTSETSPSTNGLWNVNTTGNYRIRLYGHIYTFIDGSTSPKKSYYSDYQLSSPDNHRHLTEIDYFGVGGPKLTIELWRKPVVGSIALYEDDRGYKRHMQSLKVAFADSYNSDCFNSVTTEWNVLLYAGERVSLQFSIDLGHEDYWGVQFNNTYGLFGMFEKIGPPVDWVDL